MKQALFWRSVYLVVERMAKKRVQIPLSADLERKLILWAYTRDESLPKWAKTVLQLSADDNAPKTEATLRAKAQRLGMPYEELEKKILEKYGYDFNREREELNGSDLGDDD